MIHPTYCGNGMPSDWGVHDVHGGRHHAAQPEALQLAGGSSSVGAGRGASKSTVFGLLALLATGATAGRGGQPEKPVSRSLLWGNFLRSALEADPTLTLMLRSRDFPFRPEDCLIEHMSLAAAANATSARNVGRFTLSFHVAEIDGESSQVHHAKGRAIAMFNRFDGTGCHRTDYKIPGSHPNLLALDPRVRIGMYSHADRTQWRSALGSHDAPDVTYVEMSMAMGEPVGDGTKHELLVDPWDRAGIYTAAPYAFWENGTSAYENSLRFGPTIWASNCDVFRRETELHKTQFIAYHVMRGRFVLKFALRRNKALHESCVIAVAPRTPMIVREVKKLTRISPGHVEIYDLDRPEYRNAKNVHSPDPALMAALTAEQQSNDPHWMPDATTLAWTLAAGGVTAAAGHALWKKYRKAEAEAAALHAHKASARFVSSAQAQANQERSQFDEASKQLAEALRARSSLRQRFAQLFRHEQPEPDAGPTAEELKRAAQERDQRRQAAVLARASAADGDSDDGKDVGTTPRAQQDAQVRRQGQAAFRQARDDLAHFLERAREGRWPAWEHRSIQSVEQFRDALVAVNARETGGNGGSHAGVKQAGSGFRDGAVLPNVQAGHYKKKGGIRYGSFNEFLSNCHDFKQAIACGLLPADIDITQAAGRAQLRRCIEEFERRSAN